MTNVELHKIAAIESLEYFIRRMRLRWTGHVYRLQETTPARAILKYQPKPVRPVGHPTNRFQGTSLSLIAQERAQTTVSRTLKPWQLTEHNGENSLEQPQQLRRMSPSELIKYPQDEVEWFIS